MILFNLSLSVDNFCHGDLHPGNVLVTKDFKFV